jgi:hypothetical protein
MSHASRRGPLNPMFGRRHSSETRQKLRALRLGRSVSSAVNQFKHFSNGVTIIFLEQKDGTSLPCFLDTKDYPTISPYTWCAARRGGKKLYAHSKIEGRTIGMHQLLLISSDGRTPDHKDGNGLNNQRSNLRLATRNQQSYNRSIRADNTSGTPGVSWTGRKWKAYITVDGKDIILGSFDNKDDAVGARLKAVKQYHKDFGWGS